MKAVNVLIHPVGHACNLGCDYCYNRNRAQKKFPPMTLETFIKVFVSWFSLIPDNVECDFLWHGGEPLLRGKDFFRAVAGYVTLPKFSSKKFSVCIQTNGTLIDQEWIEIFKLGGFKIGISYDGPSHDLYRKTVAGQPTANLVRKSIELLRLAGIPTGIVSVINKGNVVDPVALIKCVGELGLQKFQISPCIEGGGEDCFSITGEEFASFVCRLYDILLEESNKGFTVGYIDDILNFLIHGKCFNCLLTDRCKGFVVVDPAGNLKSCESVPFSEVSFGNISEMEISDVLESKDWINRHRELSNKRRRMCGRCEWYKVCHGNCPYYWTNDKSRLCEANKIIYEHITSSLIQQYSK